MYLHRLFLAVEAEKALRSVKDLIPWSKYSARPSGRSGCPGWEGHLPLRVYEASSGSMVSVTTSKIFHHVQLCP